MKDYQILVNSQTYQKISFYLDKLKSGANCGRYLQDRLLHLNLSDLTIIEFIEVLMRTKRPFCCVYMCTCSHTCFHPLPLRYASVSPALSVQVVCACTCCYDASNGLYIRAAYVWSATGNGRISVLSNCSEAILRPPEAVAVAPLLALLDVAVVEQLLLLVLLRWRPGSGEVCSKSGVEWHVFCMLCSSALLLWSIASVNAACASLHARLIWLILLSYGLCIIQTSSGHVPQSMLMMRQSAMHRQLQANLSLTAYTLVERVARKQSLE